MEIKTWFDIENGVKLWHELNEYKQAIKELKDGRYIITIIGASDIRSNAQNSALWAIPYEFFKRALINCGEFKNPSKEDVHEWCLVNFIPSDYRERIFEEWKNKTAILNYKTGEQYKAPFRLTTKKMKTTDMMNYYSNMQIGYAEIFSTGENDFIPDPVKKKPV